MNKAKEKNDAKSVSTSRSRIDLLKGKKKSKLAKREKRQIDKRMTKVSDRFDRNKRKIENKKRWLERNKK